MLQIEKEEFNLEDYLYELGYVFTEKQGKIGPHKVDMIGYKIHRGKLLKSLLVEFKRESKDVVQGYYQLHTYMKYLETKCDGLLVTNQNLVWFDKNGMVSEKPKIRRAQSFVKNKEDITKLLTYTLSELSQEFSINEKRKLLEIVLMLRNLLFIKYRKKEEFNQFWNKDFSEKDWEYSKIIFKKEDFLFNFNFKSYLHDLDCVKRYVSIIHPQFIELGKAYLDFLKEIGEHDYPSYIKDLIEGIFENIINKGKREGKLVFFDYEDFFFTSKKSSKYDIYLMNNDRNSVHLMSFLVTISGLKQKVHVLKDINEVDSVQYGFVDTVLHSYTKRGTAELIKTFIEKLNDEGFLFILITESNYKENEKLLLNLYKEYNELKINAIINLPEHIYRPLSRKKCKLLIFHKTHKETESYFQKDIQSLEKDISKTIGEYKRWIRGEEESYSVNSFEKTIEYSFYPTHISEQKILDQYVSINLESIKINPDKDYLYIDIQSIDRNGRIISNKTFKGEEIPSRSKYRVKEGDLVFSLLRPAETYDFNYIGYVTAEYDGAVVNSNLCVIRSKQISSKLLFFYFRNRKFIEQIKTLCRGNIPRINLSTLKELPIKGEIPVTIQHEAEDLFKESMSVFHMDYEDIIEKLFQDLVGSNFNLKHLYLGHVAEIFLGTKEKVYETYRFEEIESDLLEDYIPYIRSKNILTQEVVFQKENVEWISKDSMSIPSNHVARSNDILIDKTYGLLKKSILAKLDETIDTFLPNQHLYVVSVNYSSILDSTYLLAFLKSTYAQSQLKKDLKRFSMKDLRNLLIPVPPKEIQFEIADKILKHYKKRKVINQKIEKFNEKLQL